MQRECLGLVRALWAKSISADLLYDSMEKDSMEDIQQFCRSCRIPHLVVLGDKTLFFERKQVYLLFVVLHYHLMLPKWLSGVCVHVCVCMCVCVCAWHMCAGQAAHL